MNLQWSYQRSGEPIIKRVITACSEVGRPAFIDSVATTMAQEPKARIVFVRRPRERGKKLSQRLDSVFIHSAGDYTPKPIESVGWREEMG